MRNGFIGQTGILMCLYALAVPAEERTQYPEQIAGSTRVTAEEVVELAYQLPEMVIIDARIPMDRAQGYIEGSVSLPDIETDCEALSGHIKSVSQPVLFYCNGVKCGRSAKSTKIAIACGYSNIYWFRGGYEEWTNKNFPVVKQ